jgi:hypothetical protein
MKFNVLNTCTTKHIHFSRDIDGMHKCNKYNN